jgi:hypothetical protein
VSNTETFNFLDVWNAVKVHDQTTAGNLTDCLAKAKIEYFDPKYNDKVNLLYQEMLRQKSKNDKNE